EQSLKQWEGGVRLGRIRIANAKNLAGANRCWSSPARCLFLTSTALSGRAEDFGCYPFAFELVGRNGPAELVAIFATQESNTPLIQMVLPAVVDRTVELLAWIDSD